MSVHVIVLASRAAPRVRRSGEISGLRNRRDQPDPSEKIGREPKPEHWVLLQLTEEIYGEQTRVHQTHNRLLVLAVRARGEPRPHPLDEAGSPLGRRGVGH